MWAELSRHLADSLILPLDVEVFAAFIKSNSESILNCEQYHDMLVNAGLQHQMG